MTARTTWRRQATRRIPVGLMFFIVALVGSGGCLGGLSPQSPIPRSPAPTLSEAVAVTPSLTPTLIPTAPSTNTPTSAPTDTPTPTPTPTPSPTATPIPEPTVVRGLRVDFDNLKNSRIQVALLQERMRQAGINTVGLGAGRPDWTYFKWPGHESLWSSDVTDTGLDFLAEDVENFGSIGNVNAIVDVYAPDYIAEHPDVAAISYWGEPSALQASTASLLQGPYHDLLLDMLEYVAANYAVEFISLTELSYYTYGYGTDDLALYRAYTGRADWPRHADGAIDPDDPSIGEWRSAALAGLLAEAADRVRPHGVELWMDVSVSWGNLRNEGLEYGQHYPVLLEVADRLVVWAYTAVNDYPPEYASEIAAYLDTYYDRGRFIISVGMWDAAGGVISPADLGTGLVSAVTGGIPNLWVTPSHLMSEAHWAALARVWSE